MCASGLAHVPLQSMASITCDARHGITKRRQCKYDRIAVAKLARSSGPADVLEREIIANQLLGCPKGLYVVDDSTHRSVISSHFE